MNTYVFAATIVPVAGDSVTLAAIARPAGANASQGMIVRLLRVKVGFSKATAAGVQTVSLIKRSQNNTGGTGVAQTPIAEYDDTSPPAQAVVTLYSVAPTTGGTAETIAIDQLASGATPALGNGLMPWRWDDTTGVGVNVSMPPALRSFAAGGSQPIFALNFSAALAGQVCPIEIVWTESGG